MYVRLQSLLIYYLYSYIAAKGIQKYKSIKKFPYKLCNNNSLLLYQIYKVKLNSNNMQRKKLFKILYHI